MNDGFISVSGTAMTMEDTFSLVVAARSGDIAAYTELVRRNQAMVFGSAYAQLQDFQAAEEVAQDAFLVSWRNLGRLTSSEKFGAWLRGIVRYECSHRFRRARLVQISLEDAGMVAGTSDDPAAEAESRELQDAVLTAIADLPMVLREVTILYYLQDRSQREIGAFLGLPVTTVKNRLRSARQLLRQGGLQAMTSEEFTRHQLDDRFADRIGSIVRNNGVVADVRFAEGHLPPILTLLHSLEGGAPVPFGSVMQHLGTEMARVVMLDDASDGPAPTSTGGHVQDSGNAVSSAIPDAVIDALLDTLGPSESGTEPIETGIKVIDLFCPIAAGRLIGIVGDSQTGKMVLVEELIHRLAGREMTPLTVLVVVEPSQEVGIVRASSYRTSAQVEAIYLPADTVLPATRERLMRRLDTVIVFSRELAQRGNYPAIDPVQSTSCAPVPEIARDAREVLRAATGANDGSANEIRAFLKQWFYVAEPFTHHPGESVPVDTAIRELSRLVQH
jgi:RNA polymerase sigma-70 factor (ECF subfamily)